MQVFLYESFGNGQLMEMTDDFCTVTMMYGPMTCQILQRMLDSDWEYTGIVEEVNVPGSPQPHRNHFFRKIHRVG